MAITTLAGAASGKKKISYMVKDAITYNSAGVFSHMYTTGLPTAAAVPSPGIGGAVLTSCDGQMPFDNPSSGNTYLYNLTGGSTDRGTLWLCDRLWHNSDINVTSTSEQTFTSSVDIPARDMNGAALGHGVFAAVEITSSTGAGTPTLTFKYKNQDDVEKTGTNIQSVSSSSTGRFWLLGLAAGDTGVRRAVSLTLSASMSSGSISVVLYRPIAKLATNYRVDSLNDACCLTLGFPRAYDNTVPFILFQNTSTNSGYTNASVQWTQG